VNALAVASSVKSATATAPTIEARGLVKRFGRTVALDGLDLVAKQGQIEGTLADGPNVTHRFHKLLKRAELRRCASTTCATHAHRCCVHPRVVMETLGHSQISLTMNTYSHVLPALQREVADKMEVVLAIQG
jgi:integrase